MYLVESISDKARMAMQPPFGPGFDSAILAQADRMEIWGSSFKDEGADFCEFRLISAGVVIATRRVPGY